MKSDIGGERLAARARIIADKGANGKALHSECPFLSGFHSGGRMATEPATRRETPMHSLPGITQSRRIPLWASLFAAMATVQVSASLRAAEVLNCSDDGPGSGSLRDVVANAAPGETIDLSQLPTNCGMTDAVITLLNGEIGIPQETLRIQGPSVGTVTIKPAEGKHNRIFGHSGTGLLVINNLIVANGSVYDSYDAFGGCISSRGDVFLSRSTVTNCVASSGGFAAGGGVAAAGTLVLLSSIVSESQVNGVATGDGGGVYAKRGLSISYSTLRDNVASGSGGGAASVWFGIGTYNSYVSNSTFDRNQAGRCGAAELYTIGRVLVLNATISGNTAGLRDGGLCARGDVTVANSTIAFNGAPDVSGGLYAWDGAFELQSSIIAQNGSTPNAPDLRTNSATITGADNLVMSAIGSLPPGVVKITSDPELDPVLRYNGGPTPTHAVLSGSPAIGAGNNNGFSWWDQRGRGYPRTTGGSYATDIGAFQFDSIFFHDFDR